MTAEFTAALQLLGMLAMSPRTGVLMLLVAAAAITDVRSGRIPNWLVFGGALYALAYSALFPLHPGHAGILFALGGLALGGGALLPLYWFRAMAAGDVKLMGMVGAFLGASATVACLLIVLVAGGVLAIASALASGRLLTLFRNVAMLFRGALLTFSTGVGGLLVHDGPSAGRMPYGVAIALGTIAYLVLDQLGLL